MSDETVAPDAGSASSQPNLRRRVIDAYMEVVSFAKTLELACAQQLEVLGRGSVLMTEAERDSLLHRIHAELDGYLRQLAERSFPLSHTHAILHEAFPNAVPSSHQTVKVVAKDQHDIQPASTADLKRLERGPRIVRP